MNYTRIYEEVFDFMKTRKGIVNNPKLYKNAVRELTGMFCGIAYENDVPEEDVINFLFNAKHHRLKNLVNTGETANVCLLYTSPSPRDATLSRMPSSA